MVKNGEWPKTKKDLYEKATALLLTEKNDIHQHKAFAGFTTAQLKKAAGAACAVMLISDVTGISLLKSDEQPYSEIPNSDSDSVLAALTRRVFTIKGQEASCIHRTIAEYLAACWLVNEIKNGLPLSRVRSLLSIENHPAAELRGLYAWLTQLLQEHTNTLLEYDPYGILVLGDVGCLSLSNRKELLKALIKLSEKDPWFRGQDWTSEPLGSISTQDMADEFITILGQYPTQFHLRSLILDAISYGEPQPSLKDVLLQIFCDKKANYDERKRALNALIHAIPDGKELVATACKEKLQIDNDDLHLKEKAIAALYGDFFSVDDVIQLINDYLNLKKSSGKIDLWMWNIRYFLPLSDLPELLDRISQIDASKYETESQLWSFNYFILKDVLLSGINLEVERLWSWFSKIKFSDDSFPRKDEVKNWLDQNHHIVNNFFKIALSERNTSDNIFSFWHGFQDKVRHSNEINQIIDTAFLMIAQKNYCDENDQFIFELILCLTIRTANVDYFNVLYGFANSHPELAEIYNRSCFSEVYDWQWKQALHRNKINNNKANRIEKNRENFEKDKDLIRSGQNLGWLQFLAKIYFSRFSDLDRKQTPYQRLEDELGEQNLQLALEGLRSIINRTDLPTPVEIANLYGVNRWFEWWHGILVGLSESWKINPDLDIYPESAIKSALAINLVWPSYFEYDGNTQKESTPVWQTALFQQRPELVQSVYLEVIESLLKTKRQNIPGIHEICVHPDLAHNRENIVLKLLTDYPNAPTQELRNLLLTAVNYVHVKGELLELIQKIVQPHARVRRKQKELWLSAGLLINFDKFKDIVDCYLAKRVDFVWTLIHFLEGIRSNSNSDSCISFSASLYEYLIRLVGMRFPDAYLPTGITAHGDREPWDAAEFVKRQITQLSTRTDDAAIQTLNRLIEEPDLISYCDFIKHSVANQAALLRKEIFDRPDWQKAINTLKNGKPANIADLHALTIEHIRDIAKRIRSENTDIYKQFWNEGSYGKIEQPKPEETCRDRLIDLLRPKFTPLDINVEPEGHMVADKRADIVLLNGSSQKLPIEIKRDYHADLWSACENQLDRLYTRDPQTEKYGIYLVFWFGDQRPRSMPSPPLAFQRPNSAIDLEEALRFLIKEENRYRLNVIVIDVTNP